MLHTYSARAMESKGMDFTATQLWSQILSLGQVPSHL